MRFFTSDLHLSHANCIKYNNRPFVNTQQMDEEIIKRWNETVGENDTVYVLGDVCWGWKAKKIKEVFSKLNGTKYLIAGNHDRLDEHYKSGVWAEITGYKEIFQDGKQIVLSHYPIIDWHGAFYGSYHLHGHCHGKLDLKEMVQYTGHNNKRVLDVYIDNNDFRPYSWDDIVRILG